MANPFIGEIRMFGGNFAPRDFAFCNGQLLPISQYTALFSLLGTFYGGDGKTTFGLPDLRGRSPLHAGQGPGLTDRLQGESSGSPEVALSATEIPPHSHVLQASGAPGTTGSPAPTVLYAAPSQGEVVYGPAGDPLDTAPELVGQAGSGLPHPNRQPYLGVNFIIALQGIFPPRS